MFERTLLTKYVKLQVLMEIVKQIFLNTEQQIRKQGILIKKIFVSDGSQTVVVRPEM